MKKLLISVGFRSELMLLLRVVRIYLRVLIKYAHNRLSLLEIHHRNKRRHDQGNWKLGSDKLGSDHAILFTSHQIRPRNRCYHRLASCFHG
jgi:hypothetical protein